METDKKDKIIIALIIGIVIVISRNFVSSKNNDEFVFEKQGLSIEMKSNEDKKNNDDNKLNSESKNSIKKVHISGEINKPGVYQINEDYRLEDLVNDAGGLTENADIDKINLALKLEDQMRIIIPNINDKNNDVEISTNQLISPVEKIDDKKVNINKADKAQLMTLPNIGEKERKLLSNIEKKTNLIRLKILKMYLALGISILKR